MTRWSLLRGGTLGGMPLRRLGLLLGLLALAITATAHARHNGEPSLDHYVRADGTGMLIANPAGHPVSWERCAPAASACTPYDDGDGDPQLLVVSDEPVGTAFTATQDSVTLRSQAWRGRLRATAPPRVEGEVRVGGFVRPLPATWEGGWGREADWLQLQVCRTPAGAECTVVLDEIKFGRCRPGGGRLLPARYEGGWLRVTDVRIDQRQPFTLEGYSAPEGVRPHVPGAAGIAGAVVGQIRPGPAPIEDCGHPDGFAPGWRLRISHVVLTRTRLSMRVSMPALLRVRIARRTGRPYATRWRRVRSFTLRARAAGRATRRLRRLHPGRYRISVRSAGGGSRGLERTFRRTVRR